jgi:hypothetical protein
MRLIDEAGGVPIASGGVVGQSHLHFAHAQRARTYAKRQKFITVLRRFGRLGSGRQGKSSSGARKQKAPGGSGKLEHRK